MNNKTKFFVVMILMLAILFGTTSCSSKNAECKVTLDRNGNLDIIVNPPGETGEASQEGSLRRQTSISASGGSSNKVVTYDGEIAKQYTETGNSYKVNVDITIEGDRLTAYKLTVTGGVYGESPHICSYP